MKIHMIPSMRKMAGIQIVENNRRKRKRILIKEQRK